MRFYADLLNASVMDASSVYLLLDTFLNAATSPGVAEERADCFVYIVLCTICWVCIRRVFCEPWSREKAENRRHELKKASKKMNQMDAVGQDRVLALCEAYMNQRSSPERVVMRSKSLEAVTYLRGGLELMPDMLESLWAQILELPNSEWEVSLRICEARRCKNVMTQF